MKVQFTLTGVMPLLQHNNDVESQDAVKEWQKDPANKNMSVAGDDRSPPWTWQTYLYTDGDNIAYPSQNIMVCLRQAATQMILKKQKTFKEISQSGMVILDEFCQFTNNGQNIAYDAITDMRDDPFKKQTEKCEKLGFKLFVKRAKVGTSQHVRVRPRFEQWAITGTLLITAPEITFEHLETMFSLAGRVGLGDWRPGCKTPGPFGMFEAKLKKVG